MLHASSSSVGKHLLLVVTSCFGTAVGATLRHRCVGLITLACGICGIFCLVRFGFSHELRHWQTGFPCADGVWCLTGVQQHDFLAKSWLEAYGWQAQKKAITDMSDMLHSITLLKMIGCPFSCQKNPSFLNCWLDIFGHSAPERSEAERSELAPWVSVTSPLWDLWVWHLLPRFGWPGWWRQGTRAMAYLSWPEMKPDGLTHAAGQNGWLGPGSSGDMLWCNANSALLWVVCTLTLLLHTFAYSEIHHIPLVRSVSWV